MNKMSIIMLAMFFNFQSIANVQRISKQQFDLSKPFIIHMTPKRTTLIKFPCDISHSILGSNEDIDIQIGPDSKKNLVLWMPNVMSQPTNMIVPCGDEEYAFDIYPNTVNHQYIIEITNSFDSSGVKRKLISSSSDGIKSSLKKVRKRILSSKDKSKVIEDKVLLKKLNQRVKKRKLISKGHRNEI
jgi:hypothetical protein